MKPSDLESRRLKPYGNWLTTHTQRLVVNQLEENKIEEEEKETQISERMLSGEVLVKPL